MSLIDWTVLSFTLIFIITLTLFAGYVIFRPTSKEELKIGQKVKLVKSYKPGMVFEKIIE